MPELRENGQSGKQPGDAPHGGPAAGSGAPAKRINLALQGGGAHGAFGWGVIDYLLEDGRLDVEGISATSAGAVNAALYAFGMLKGGREGARRALRDFWRATADAGAAYRATSFDWMAVNSAFGRLDEAQLQSLFQIPRKALSTYLESLAELNPFLRFPFHDMAPQSKPSRNLANLMFHTMSSMFSPYYFNPGNYNPLKDLLEAHVDFTALRQDSNGVGLHICATNIETGKIRIFRNKELTVDTILASTCLPFLFQAVEIDGEYYWDGGYIGNPAIFPLIYESQSCDVVIIHIDPIVRKGCPQTTLEIINRANEVAFNSSLMREMRAIAFVNQLMQAGKIKDETMKQMRMHAIRAEKATSQLSALTKTETDWTFLQSLFASGRAAAAEWLDQNFHKIGHESTVNVETDYL